MSLTQDFFETQLPNKIASNPEAAKSIGAVFLFNVMGDGGGQWTADLKDALSVVKGDSGRSECTLECTITDWEQILSSPQAAMQLYFEGKLKVSGNVMLATKLQQILA